MKRRKAIARIGPYTVVSELGRGGMGVVYRARHKDINRDIALKMISRDAGATDEQIERFRREAHAASQLASHPNIVGVHDVGEDDGVLYLAMDLIEGRPLDDLAAEGELTLEQCARIGEQVAHALAHAHEKKILHRDIKPANILVTDHLSAHLTDFGLARAQATDASNLKLTVSGELLGTPAYMPPEQARGEEVDHRADIYSLGATLYELVSGKPPFQGESIYSVIGQVLKKPPVPLRKLNPNVPRDLETIILTCLQKHPRARYQSAAKLADDLARFRLGASISASRSQVERGLRASSGGGAGKWLAIAAVVALVAGGGWALTRGSGTPAGRGSKPGGGNGSGNGSPSTSSGDAKQPTWARAYATVAGETGEALQRLEDHWAGVDVDERTREQALRLVVQTTRAAEKAHPKTQTPDAWRAFARWLSGEGGAAADSLQRAVEQADDEPFPDMLLARMHLARWASTLEVPWVQPAVTDPDVLVPPVVETAVQQQWRKDAATALDRAAKVKGWKASGAGPEYRQFGAAVRQLAEGEFADAAHALAELTSDPALGATSGFLAGASWLVAGRPADAVPLLEQVAQSRGWPAAWQLAGQAHLMVAAAARGDARTAALDQALAAFDGARAAAPARRAALLGRAVVEWIRAADAQVAGQDPTPVLQRAMTEWQGYLEQMSEDPIALWQQGSAYVRKADWLGHNGGGGGVEGAFRSGIDSLERARTGWPDHPGVASTLVEALALLGSYQVSENRDPTPVWNRARQIADETVGNAPTAFAPLFARARLLKTWVTHGRVDRDRAARMLGEAVSDISQALELVPGHLGAHYMRGEIENDRGLQEDPRRGGDPVSRFRAAIRDYGVVLEARPEDRDALRSRGGARVNMANSLSDQKLDPTGAYRAGKGDLDTLLRLDPSDVVAHLFRAHCCKGWGRWLDQSRSDPVSHWRQAIADYEYVVNRNPDVVGQRINLGGTQINLGLHFGDRNDDPLPLYEAGIRTLSDALKLEPQNVTALIFRGHGYNNTWNWLKNKGAPNPDFAKRAIADYQAAIEAEPRAKRDLQPNIERLTAEIAESGG